MSGIKTYSKVEEILADPEIDLIDICLPTPLHARITIAALRAGKHVFCEKPMAMNEDECAEMEAVALETGKQLMIGHCLRYWPEYVIADGIIKGGEYGRVLSAGFHRSTGMPLGSFENWLATSSQSGGAVLDMHIHDVDTALWWFGEPTSTEIDGVIWRDLPLSCYPFPSPSTPIIRRCAARIAALVHEKPRAVLGLRPARRRLASMRR